ncbi:hypothetical protein M409DRAFT_22412 [Zasmidium cellare ATCC 36951]|uniref:Major facilitator superfamily (MFS) profile domain-containing protein n=1 Tax=Zasmidium cellare ATCC 36951 TaxID=1080233 RepID=A0A6A6CKN7_ZASCE|nr:uncharacterized protein M409DRAFT_22412 [Zasmidium cellare ATCC 36951]KAF2167611.1 hypothetical protein M409DRAFT_22412 [Zasmidium cellare ATCC 36951]
MGVLDNLRHRQASIEHGAAPANTAGLSGDDFKNKEFVGDVEASGSDSDRLSIEAKNEKEVQQHPDQVTDGAQRGIQKAEAAALVWSKKAIFAIYAWIWLCYFMLAFQQGVQGYVTVYAYSTFKTAPAINTAVILAQIIGGILRLPIAKLINVWGRAETFALFVGFYLLGMIVLASSSGPDSYAAGYVLYWIGYDAIYLILDIFIADSFGLRNRALAFAFASTPFIITAFTSSLAAESFLSNQITGAGWRWGIGTFCITNFVVFAPLSVVFWFYTRKAIKMGVYKPSDSGRTTLQSIWHYFHEFGVPGALILMAAFCLFLLPFSLQTYGRAPYDSATFIAMVIIGFLLFFVFAAWEKWFARVHFIRYDLLRERTVLGSCMLALVLYMAFYGWDLNYYNYVLVDFALPVSLGGYMNQIYNVGSCFWSCLIGVFIYYTKHFKWLAFVSGLCFMLLANGLRIYFTSYNAHIGYIIMVQIFNAFAGGTIVICNEMAVMAASDREGVPLMLSMLYLFNAVGGAIGQAVSATIYSNTFPQALRHVLPEDRWNKVPELYAGGYVTQIMFPPGTIEREASDYAWRQTQYYGSIFATCVLVLGIPAILLWKNYRVDKKQNKGTVL